MPHSALPQGEFSSVTLAVEDMLDTTSGLEARLRKQIKALTSEGEEGEEVIQ
jgi:hypothetical protein